MKAAPAFQCQSCIPIRILRYSNGLSKFDDAYHVDCVNAVDRTQKVQHLQQLTIKWHQHQFLYTTVGGMDHASWSGPFSYLATAHRFR